MPSFTSSLYSKKVIAGNKLEKLPQERNCNWDNVGNLQKWQLMSPWDMITRKTHMSAWHLAYFLHPWHDKVVLQPGICSGLDSHSFPYKKLWMPESFSCYSNLWKGKREGKASLDHQQSVITRKVSSLFSSEMGMRRVVKTQTFAPKRAEGCLLLLFE